MDEMMYMNIDPTVLVNIGTSLFTLPSTVAQAATSLESVKDTLMSATPSAAIYAMGMVGGASLYCLCSEVRRVHQERKQMELAYQSAGHAAKKQAQKAPHTRHAQDVPYERDLGAQRSGTPVHSRKVADVLSERLMNTQMPVEPTPFRANVTMGDIDTSRAQGGWGAANMPGAYSNMPSAYPYQKAYEAGLQHDGLPQDEWSTTLDALDQRAQEPASFGFDDFVSKGNPFYEPEGLEHPRDVISDKGAVGFLKVIEGGSQSMPRVAGRERTAAPRRRTATPRVTGHSAPRVAGREQMATPRRRTTTPRRRTPRHQYASGQPVYSAAVEA